MIDRVLLLKPPFFSPLTPPLGIANLKAFLARHGIAATCIDMNVDGELWYTHHEYFTLLRTNAPRRASDGYSQLWPILNAHMLAWVNGASEPSCARLIEHVAHLYGLSVTASQSERLSDVVRRHFARLEHVVDEWALQPTDLVGTSTYTTSLAPSLHILKRVKAREPRCVTVMGGGIFADDCAFGSSNLQTLLRDYDYIDHVVLGEGELPLLRLARGELHDRRLVSLSDYANQVLAINDVPAPDFSDFDVNLYSHLSIEGARSCPFQCSFCSETVQWGDYRMKDAELLASQLAGLTARYGNPNVFLGDSLVNPYIGRLSQALRAKGVALSLDGYLRADKPVADPARVRTWAMAGLSRARLGIESASANVLQSMSKMTTPETIGQALRTLADEGIRTTTYWIVGYPGETEDDFEETLEFIRAHRRDIYELEAHPHYYYPYGQIGSRLFKSVSLFGKEYDAITKFQQWEVEGVEPGRAVKYDRLQRLTAVANECGIPNIYTLADLSRAERRWYGLAGVYKAQTPWPPQAARRVPPRRVASNRDAALVVQQVTVGAPEPLDHEALTRANEICAASHASVGSVSIVRRDPSTTDLRFAEASVPYLSAYAFVIHLHRVYAQLRRGLDPTVLPLPDPSMALAEQSKVGDTGPVTITCVDGDGLMRLRPGGTLPVRSDLSLADLARAFESAIGTLHDASRHVDADGDRWRDTSIVDLGDGESVCVDWSGLHPWHTYDPTWTAEFSCTLGPSAPEHTVRPRVIGRDGLHWDWIADPSVARPTADYDIRLKAVLSDALVGVHGIETGAPLSTTLPDQAVHPRQAAVDAIAHSSR